VTATGSFTTGNGGRELCLSSLMDAPHRIALCWQGSPDTARLLDPASAALREVQGGDRWLVADVSAGDPRLRVDGVHGSWNLAWHPLVAEEYPAAIEPLQTQQRAS
jgi:hypothetical protein